MSIYVCSSYRQLGLDSTTQFVRLLYGAAAFPFHTSGWHPAWQRHVLRLNVACPCKIRHRLTLLHKMFDYQHNAISLLFTAWLRLHLRLPKLDIWPGTSSGWLLQQFMIHLWSFLAPACSGWITFSICGSHGLLKLHESSLRISA